MISYMVRGKLGIKKRDEADWSWTFHISAKLREKNKDSPLNKFLPGGSMSSTRQSGMEEQHSLPEANSADTELIEQLQLELEEARRTIRSHETKILVLQDGWRSFWDNYSRFIQYLWRDIRGL